MIRHDPDEYARRLRGAPNGDERRGIVRHLLTVRRTRGEAAVVERRAGERPAAPDYGPAFRRLSFRLADHMAEMARQRQRLPALLERLRELPPGDRRIVLR